MEKNTQLTVWQRLQQTFGPDALLNQDYPTYKLNKKELLKTTSKAEYEREKLEAQQSYYLSGQWTKIENNLYTQAVYYEPTRLASFYDYESMEYSIVGDTKIATPEGFITIKELADKGRDYEFITYAYDHNLKKVVPAKARNAHYTRDEMTYKITFDDGSYIIATYGHRFLKRDGTFCEVENLKHGDSMMPFYRKSFYNNEKYNWVYTCNSNEGHNGWVSEHNLIAEWFYDVKINNDEEVHHLDFNGKNNLPENLQIMKISEHRAYHARLNNEKLWSNPEYRQKMSEVAKRKGKMVWGGRRSGDKNPAHIKITFEDIIENARKHRTLLDTAKSLKVSYRKIQNELRFNGFKNWFDFLDVYKIPRYLPHVENRDVLNFKVIPWDLLIEVAKNKGTMQATSDYLGIGIPKLRSTLRSGGFNNWTTFTSAYGIIGGKTGRKKKTEDVVINHKIVSIEPYGIVPVYDLTVPGYKNFATDTIFSHNTPEISAALDIYGEECTTADQNGHVLQIYSESKRIKSILADLFNNVLDIATNLPMWTRNTCKYGDNFVYLKLDPDKGIVGCTQLPNIEIERLERSMGAKNAGSTETQENLGLRFKWKVKDMEFNSWEIAHFRLLGDDRRLPYGTSMLEKARRIWKQLLLSEDAMLVYRTSRAPERRVFKVFVGNMDDKDVEPYVQRVANKFKRDQVVDHKNGNVDLRFNQMAVDQDYFIPVRDPAAPSPIETLAGAQNLGEIADIEYIQKKLLTALRVPKAFLGFEEIVGEGKNLSLLDIRFARTINRIQKSMIAELNKIAIIHLFLLGFEDELNNFTLGLTNPSTQADLLKIDVWKEKIMLYRDAVTAVEGIAPVSVSWAKKHILGFSDEEIKLDLQQQRIEKAVGAELTNTPTIITHTGVFDNIDKLYGTKTGTTQNVAAQPPEGPSPGGGGLGSDLGMDLGGEDLGGDLGGAPEPAPTPEAGPPAGAEPEVTPESTKKDDMNILLEGGLINEDIYIDLGKGRNSLGTIGDELNKLLGD
jgi:intein/homing endonuclease